MELVVHGEEAIDLVVTAVDDLFHLFEHRLERMAILLVILLAGKAHDAGLDHLTQLHQIVEGILIQDDAVDHRIDHALLEAAANKGPL